MSPETKELGDATLALAKAAERVMLDYDGDASVEALRDPVARYRAAQAAVRAKA